MVSQEELENMSPEQIAELQKKNCIFCQIISGRIPSKKVFEDDKTIAILDINPANPGHVLLMPKDHFMVMPQMPEDLIGHLGKVSKALSHAILRALKVEGVNIFIANGAVGGQKTPHFMVHLIPRMPKDGLDNKFKLQRKKIEDKMQKQNYERLIPKVNEKFGTNLDPSKLKQKEDTKKQENKESKKNIKDNNKPTKENINNKTKKKTKEDKPKENTKKATQKKKEIKEKTNKPKNNKKENSLDAVTALLGG